MNAVARFAALAKMPAGSPQQYAALAQAVSLELGLVDMYLDLRTSKAANDNVSLSLMDAKGAPPNLAAVKAALGMKYPTASDTPASSSVAARIEQWFHTGMNDIDVQWANLFRLVDLRDSNQDSFDIFTGTFPVVFKQRAPGEKIEVARVPSETETSVKMVEYGAGVGILDRWLRYNKWWDVEEVVLQFRSQHWDQMAQRHYGLFTSQGAGINVSHIANDDLGVRTLNAAAGQIYRAQEGKGTGVSANTPLWIVTSPERVGYVTRILAATQGSLVIAYSGAEPITARIAGVISTNHVASNDTGYYLVLPARKIARGLWQDLQTEQVRDAYKRADDIVGTSQYAGILGDTSQVRRVLFPT